MIEFARQILVCAMVLCVITAVSVTVSLMVDTNGMIF